MNALEANVWTAAWREFGASLPALRGVVAISAHWYVGATAVTAMDHPRTIHDFTGFPPELFAMQYPAPGDPGLAGEVADLLAPIDVVADTAAWGLDHGTWSVLCHVLPDASVPVVQLSIDSSASWDDHVRMGSRLEPLRHDGVLIIGRGRRAPPRRGAPPPPGRRSTSRPSAPSRPPPTERSPSPPTSTTCRSPTWRDWPPLPERRCAPSPAAWRSARSRWRRSYWTDRRQPDAASRKGGRSPPPWATTLAPLT